jgi:uncharacterized membrane protein YeaQ/YmgE (transglycosylase-associated protein family)
MKRHYNSTKLFSIIICVVGSLFLYVGAFYIGIRQDASVFNFLLSILGAIFLLAGIYFYLKSKDIPK